MDKKFLCLVVCAFLGLCNSAFVDTLGKCSYKDDKCVANTIQYLIKEASDNGIQELDIPRVDPMELKKLPISIFGLFNVILDEGQVHGVKSCMIGSIHNNLDEGFTNLDLTCDVTIKAKFSVDDTSPIIKSLFGQDAINGEGNIKVNIEKLHMKMQFFYHVIKKDDGDIYFKLHLDDYETDFEVENLKINANKIFFGKLDVSEFVETFFNQNWKTILPTFGRIIFDVAMKIFTNILNSFFDKTPAKYYYTEDLTSFVKN